MITLLEVPTPIRTHAVVMVRVTLKEKKQLQKAALLAGRKTADFVRFNALKAAEAEIAKAASETRGN
jgi:uncharacterized protein (DUF1778 family)